MMDAHVTVMDEDGAFMEVLDHGPQPDLLMYLDTLSPLIAIVVVALVIGWIVTTWLRIKNGYPLTGSWGQAVHPRKKEDDPRIQQLTQENAQLRGDLSTVKERLANVERIVTDSGYHLAGEFERLRADKEKA